MACAAGWSPARNPFADCSTDYSVRSTEYAYNYVSTVGCPKITRAGVTLSVSRRFSQRSWSDLQREKKAGRTTDIIYWIRRG